MLKWTVMNKRTSVTTTTLPSVNGVREATNENDNRKTPKGLRHSQQQSTSTVQRRHTFSKNLNKLKSTSSTNRRHSHAGSGGGGSNKKWDKENQFFNSTPKTKDSISYIRFDTIALRDVSNITPTNTPPNRNIICNKRCRSQPHENKYLSIKRSENDVIRNKLTYTPPSSHRPFAIIENNTPSTKKLCLRHPNSHVKKSTRRSLQPNFEMPTPSKNVLNTYPGKEFIQQIRENEPPPVKIIENTLPGAEKQNTYASTLPTFQIEYSPCPMRPTQSCLGICNNKMVPQGGSSMLPPYKSVGILPNFNNEILAENCPSIKKSKIDHFTDFLTQISSVASPEDIGMQFTDLKQKRIAPPVSVTPLANRLADLRFSKIINDSVTSDEFDKLPLDQMVDEILENTTCVKESTPNKENDLNETQEDNYVNLEQEKKQSELKNTPTTLVQPSKMNNLVLSAKVVKINSCVSPEVFNEREVKTPENKLTETPSKLSFENLNICSNRKGVKRSNSATEDSTDNMDEGFTLKRQKCVRRKRFELQRETNNNNALILDNGIPSPNSAFKNINHNNSITQSSSCFNLIAIDQEVKFKRRPIVLPDEPLTPKSDLDIERLLKENLEETPLSLFPGYRKINSQNMLTLPEGIPSPGTPLSSLKKCRVARKLSPKVLSDTFVIDPERSQLFGLTLANGIPSPPMCGLEKKHDRSFEQMETPYSEPWTPIMDDKKVRTRRCLSFMSPDSSLDLDLRNSEKCTPVVRRCKSKDNFTARGSINLTMRYENGRLLVHVIGCKDLYRPNEKSVNAYVKVSLISATSNGDCDSMAKERSAGGLHRTAVHKNSTNPHFDQMFCFDIVSKTDFSKRIQIAVWHRDREYRRSEFLGCTTFAVKHAIKKEISGTFKLQSQTTNRAPQASGQSNSNISIPQQQEQPSTVTSANTTENHQTLVPSTCSTTSTSLTTSPNETISIAETVANNPKDTTAPQEVSNSPSMGDFSQSSVEEIISLDEIQDVVTQDFGKSSSKKKLNEQQKVADENLFLRYLELDPTEGPEAIPAALQRKASGNKSGRTPFTTTRRLQRPPDSGFGFSVVWTHPPRVERVERGLPAERAGILPGDYIIFVDKHNVVMMPEVDILNLIRSYGNQLILEVYRRQGNVATNICSGSTQNGLVSSSRSASVTIVAPMASALGASIAPTSAAITSMVGGSSVQSAATQQPRSSTACSINTTSDYNRRRLHLPQVTFSSENTTTGGVQSPEDIRKRTFYQLVHREQQYATAMQFSMGRFVAPLAERTDLLAPTDHRALFQNSQDLLQLTEEILDHIILEDGDPQVHLIPKVYSERVAIMSALYKKYCAGIKKADCVLANKTRNTSSEFVRFLHNPTIPRRRPDITGFIHKPLEHFREVLKLLQTILTNTKSNQDDYQMISKVVQELQITYRDITSNSGLMEPVGEGRPLLSIQDLESRLVFTRCKPFVLNVPGRQWIFGGDLSRVEGRNIRPYWALLFSDILLFAKVSRDRVLFITEEPLPLINVTEVFFNIRKKATEFRINITPGGKPAESPTAHCGPDLSRTPRKGTRRRCVVLRAPNNELKAVWQNLLQKQIYLVHSGIGLTPLSSPMDSPDAPITSSVATLQSGDSYSFRRQTPTHQLLQQHIELRNNSQKQLNELIEHKCRQLGKSGTNKGSALHLAQWIKGQLGTNINDMGSDGSGGGVGLGCCPSEEGEPEVWTEEELRRRSRELHLIDVDLAMHSNIKTNGSLTHQSSIRQKEFFEQRCDSVLLSDVDGSPSKSTTSGSQVTVRSSPLVPEKVPVCRQCHKTCLTTHPNSNINRTNNNLSPNSNYCNNLHSCDSECNNNQETNQEDNSKDDPYSDDWGSLMLMGLSAINPTTSLIQLDPFAPNNTKTVPEISVLPPTPDTLPRSTTETSHFPLTTDQEKISPKSSPRHSPKRKLQLQKTVNDDESPEDSPLAEDPPYLVMVPKNPGLKRYGTWSSLGRIPSDELVEAPDDIGDEPSSSEEEDEDEDEDDDDEDDDNIEPITQSIIGWTTRAGSFVAEKMAMFEKLGEESRAAIAGYLRPTDSQIKSDPETDLGTISSGGAGIDDEYENSGATSGEEIWGTPTSGGELDEIPTFPNSQGESLSSPHDSTSSANCDEDDLMMDELLMAPPMTAAAVRGLLPRRRLEPLMEEDDTESCTTGTSAPNLHDTTPSPEQVKTIIEDKPILKRGSEYGDVADTSSAVEDTKQSQTESSTKSTTSTKTPPPPPPRRHIRNITTTKTTSSIGASSTNVKPTRMGTGERTSSVQQSPTSQKNEKSTSAPSEKSVPEKAERAARIKKHPPVLIRASSYKHIIEEDSSLFSTTVNHNNNVTNKTKPAYSKKISSIVNNTPDIDVEHNVIVNPASCRSKSTRLLEFLSGRRQDDLLMGLDASYGQRNQGSPGRSKQILKLFSRDGEGAHITTFSQRPFSPRRQNDKQLDRRFWKQLQRRRRGSLGSQIPAA